VEDDKDIGDLMVLHLQRDGYETVLTQKGEEALVFLESATIDLIVLDWTLPGLSGLEICKRIRSFEGSRSTIPVLMVTARNDDADIVLGLEFGADDYLTKPFSIPIFLARVRALIRRSINLQYENKKHFRLGELELNTANHEVHCGADKLDLTTTEFKILLALVQNHGRVLSRKKIIEIAQGDDVVISDRAVDMHVFGLRKKLGYCANFIETIRGVGYRIKAL
jgi:DNA-binding response OmpR family regulator